MVNGEKAFGVIRVFLVFPWHILGQEVQSLVSAVSRHLLACDHFQQGKQNILQVLTRVCQSWDKSKKIRNEFAILTQLRSIVSNYDNLQ